MKVPTPTHQPDFGRDPIFHPLIYISLFGYMCLCQFYLSSDRYLVKYSCLPASLSASFSIPTVGTNMASGARRLWLATATDQSRPRTNATRGRRDAGVEYLDPRRRRWCSSVASVSVCACCCGGGGGFGGGGAGSIDAERRVHSDVRRPELPSRALQKVSAADQSEERCWACFYFLVLSFVSSDLYDLME